MKIGIFGGTFNPPHMGHVEAARACAAALGLDRLWFIPAAQPPHKPLPEGGATAAQRLEMAGLAAALVPGGAACGIELERPGPSYTVDTLRELAQAHPGDDLWLIIGSDMLLSFDRWYDYRGIAALARLAAVSRAHGDRPALLRKAAELESACGARIDFVENPPLPMSSTDVRGGPERAELPETVAVYVIRHGLYSDRAVLAALRQVAALRLSARRLAHVLATETMAARLAILHGEDETAARKAALLHDITKDIPTKKQLQMCQKWGIIPDYPPGEFDHLLHAQTAAEAARREFGMPPAICQAIACHTTGCPGMSRLDKILYVADKVEETRSFSDVPPIRKLAETDLCGAARAVLRGCLEALERQGRPADGRTLKALASLEE